MATAIFYGSNTGNCEDVAKKIAKKLGNIDIFNLDKTKIEKINEYDKIILGASTWGDGELNDDWESAWDDFKELDLSNKTIALFGLGDQESYCDEFSNAIGIIYEHLQEIGIKVVGFTSTEGYYHDYSKAQINKEFVGLVIDEDNQSDLTDERIENWVNQIKSDIL
ncbi:flavodoxin [Aliarcobacter lanthieri]|uniref:flavodoxin n=1 Tax=Arcobacteraceae TaxID=2808963 RepID=UPI000DEB8596|nr:MULTISPECIES: flavodoxin [Arcobacteraceae]MBL3519047.1 flavodoxin [Aliarcobacter lanthieri]RBQ26854.1 flavodoxin [Arcobacter sp. CECT 9188]